jgi:hypothetical protein
MSSKPASAQRAGIIVGKPLPFSVFGADGRLLLAEGSVVPDDYTRYVLLRNGVYRDAAEAPAAPGGHAVGSVGIPCDSSLSPLEALRQDYGATSAGRRFALTIVPAGSDETYTAWVVGVHGRSILLTAPRQSNGSLLPMSTGHAWVCRAFQMTSAFRFRSTVQKVLFEPFPQVLIEAPEHVERRTVRSRPRAAVFVPVSVEAPVTSAAMMVDLSVSGGRLGVEAGVELERAQPLRLRMTLDLLDTQFELQLDAHVVASFGPSDGRHPRVCFYGIKFERTGDFERLVLHGYVSGQLAHEANSLWQLLSTAVPVIGEEKR